MAFIHLVLRSSLNDIDIISLVQITGCSTLFSLIKNIIDAEVPVVITQVTRQRHRYVIWTSIETYHNVRNYVIRTFVGIINDSVYMTLINSVSYTS